MSTVSATSRPGRRDEAERVMDLVDVSAVGRALCGSKVALTALERGAVITLCDKDGVDRELTARGLGITRGTLGKTITEERGQRHAAFMDALAAGTVEPALELVDAVHARDVEAVAEILTELSVQGLYALAVVLADMARDPGADDAHPSPP